MVGLGKLVALVQLVQDFVLLARGLAWVLLLEETVLGLGFLLGLGILVLRFLLGLGCFLGCVSGLVLDFRPRCLIRILRSLRPVLGLGLGLGLMMVLELWALLEGLSSLLERQAWAWLVLVALQELW